MMREAEWDAVYLALRQAGAELRVNLSPRGGLTFIGLVEACRYSEVSLSEVALVVERHLEDA